MRIPASSYEIGDGELVGDYGVLWQQSYLPRNFSRRQTVNSATVEKNGPAPRCEHPRYGFEQRRFPTAVRADDGCDAAIGDVEVDVAENGPITVGDGEAVGHEAGLVDVHSGHACPDR